MLALVMKKKTIIERQEKMDGIKTLTRYFYEFSSNYHTESRVAKQNDILLDNPASAEALLFGIIARPSNVLAM
ncbi:hypothetical protein N7537_012334 [Penicillium hordei]|uniref:Uncharacterized protein n=1 Tax=Penicillium hordei TaxID=40994 RepID=A0AAD6DNU9_9EURO|nr:uncharacterized protein N7537_012334 [Penicillium hordei]KAJ5589656.1 hypothetical protein N7537_012334 [Penicillium hordei]